MPPVPSELLIIGVGLIGGSLALGLKAADPGLKIVGAGRRVETLKKALEMGAIDRYDTDIAAAAATADMVMLAVPMTAMRPLLETIYPVLKKAAVVTDAGSVKGSFIKETKQIFGDLHNVVPGHPIAGNENSGIDAAFSTLFENRRVILTPTAETSAAAVQQVERLWRLCNANVEVMDADEHDRVLAATSHLPHVLSYSLVDTLLSCPEREAIFRYAAGGFRDFTRIASSDPVMWRDICLSNRESLLSMIDRLQINLQGLRKLISRADGEALQEIFSRTKKARDEHYE
jgi:prephenate dehydrogenase